MTRRPPRWQRNSARRWLRKGTEMPTFSKPWAILIIILGVLIGAILIAPLLNLQFPPDSDQTSLLHETAKILHISPETLGGAIIGSVISFFLTPLIFYQDPKIKNSFERLEFGRWTYLVHPTRLPLSIGVIWFLFMAVFFYALDYQIGEFKTGINTNLDYITLLPFLLLMGLSGFRMIKRNETVHRFGRVSEGFWAYLNGTVFMLFGWGGFVYLLLAWIFNW